MCNSYVCRVLSFSFVGFLIFRFLFLHDDFELFLCAVSFSMRFLTYFVNYRFSTRSTHFMFYHWFSHLLVVVKVLSCAEGC